MKHPACRRAAIIVAAGQGKRFQGSTPKQFVELNGRPIVHYSLERFIQTALFDQIVVVVPLVHVERVRGEIQALIPPNIRFDVVPGGEARQDSVWNGLDQIESPCNIVLVHDGVRPFPSQELIRCVVEAAQDKMAVVPVVPFKDTVKRLNSEQQVVETIERQNLRAAQTPQGFQFEILKQAHAAAQENRYTGTDDAALVEKMGTKVVTVPGEENNIKITTLEDLRYANCLLVEEQV